MKELSDRTKELMTPIDQQILMCDDPKELLLLACCMLQRTTEIFDRELTKEGRILMFKDLCK